MPREPAERRAERDDSQARRAWRAIATLAARQQGHVSRAQLRDAGLSRDAVAAAVRDSRLFRRPAGVFLVGHTCTAPGAERWAAVLAAGPGAVLSHRAAAAVWGLLPSRQPLDVIAPARTRSSAPIVLHGHALDHRRDVTHRRGLPLTTLSRTIVDLAEVVPEAVLAVAVNEAALKGRLHPAAVEEILRRARGRRGARALRRVLAARDRSRGVPRSRLERAFARLAREAGLPRYERGKHVDLGGGELRECDVMWRAHRVMVELDTLPIHESGQAPVRDRRRDRRLQAAGWLVFRLTWDDLTRLRDETVADLRAALAAREPAERRA